MTLRSFSATMLGILIVPMVVHAADIQLLQKISNPLDAQELLEAARDGKLETIRALVDKGIPLDVIDNQGRTPLYLAAQNGHDGCVEELLYSVAQHNIATYNHSTPTHAAAAGGHIGCLLLLLSEGALVDEVDDCRRTSLHLAAANGHEKIVELLLRYGANKNAFDTYGRTPLHHAASHGHLAALNSLLALRAETEFVDIFDFKAFNLAVFNNRPTCITRLSEYAKKHPRSVNPYPTNMPQIIAPKNGRPLDFIPLLPFIEDPDNS